MIRPRSVCAPPSRPIEFVIQTSAEYGVLDSYVKKVTDQLDDHPILTNVESDLKLNKPEFRVELDRQKVADLGLDVAVVGRTLESLLGGRQVTRFEREGKQYDVYVQLAAEDRASPATLETIFVRGSQGEQVQLSNIVRVGESVAPKELKRFNQLRAATISANVRAGYSLGEGLDAIEQVAREVLPAGVQRDVSGQSREFRAAGQSLVFIFLLALGFIFLVLAAQFESFRDPIIILLTVPLSMTGALGALLASGGTLNVYSQIGLVTLVGLITKHGILIVEFANQQQEAGRDKLSAVIEAASLRLRPILMTTGAMVLGALPLALAAGAGAESRHQIGWVVVGGMTVGTLLTLFVVPAVYSFIGATHRDKAALATADRSGAAAGALGCLRRAAVLVEHVDRAPGRQDRAFLPGADVAQVLAREVERTVRLAQHRVVAVLLAAVARRDAEAVGHLRPGDRHRALELLAAAGMQRLDRRAAHLELRRQGLRRDRIGAVTRRIGAEQNALRREQPVARVPDHGGAPLHPGNAAVDVVVLLPEPARLPGNLDRVAVLDGVDRAATGG